MKSIYIYIIILSGFNFCSCGRKNNESITITGCVKGLPQRIYLTGAYSYNKFIDSAVCTKDSFTFHIKTGVSFRPYPASLSYIDKKGKISTLDFKNDILSTQKQGYLMNSFIVEKGNIYFQGSADIREDVIMGTNIPIHIDSISISAGLENNAYFRTQMMQFGYLDAEVAERTSQLEIYISIIKKYPGSEFLLSQINENKSVIKKAELSLMLKAFNENALLTNTGKKLQDYLAAKLDNPLLENLVLESSDAKPAQIFDTTSKINMTIVWASWCGPCRQEIPEIKKLFDLYSKKGLSVTNISIDENKDSWQNALTVEKMAWKQLIVPIEMKQNFNKTFEVGSIPYVIFTDGKGKLINRFIGYDKTDIAEYRKVIEEKLK